MTRDELRHKTAAALCNLDELLKRFKSDLHKNVEMNPHHARL